MKITSTSNVKRVEYLDITKGVAMLWVILGHSIGGPLRTLIYIVHLPMFFIVSGYFTKRWVGKDTLTKNVNLLLPYIIVCILLIPHCIWGSSQSKNVLSIIMSLVYGSGVDVGTINFGHKSISIYGVGPIWFLPLMFVAKNIYQIISLIDKFLIRITVLVVFLCFGIGLGHIGIFPLSFDVALVVMAFMEIGSDLKQYKVFEKISEFKKNQEYLIFFGFVVIEIVLILLGGRLELSWRDYGSIWPVSILSSMLGSMVIIYILKKLSEGRAKVILKSLGFVGKYSLVFMCVHSIELIYISWSKIESGWIALLFRIILNISVSSIIVFVVNTKKNKQATVVEHNL